MKSDLSNTHTYKIEFLVQKDPEQEFFRHVCVMDTSVTLRTYRIYRKYLLHVPYSS